MEETFQLESEKTKDIEIQRQRDRPHSIKRNMREAGRQRETNMKESNMK